MVPGQPVEVRVAKRLTENYSPPPKSAFGGVGNRLGSPASVLTPGGSGGTPAAAMPGSFPSTSDPAIASSGASGGGGAERQSVNTLFEVDQTLPTTSVQIRLADGTRCDIHSLFIFI